MQQGMKCGAIFMILIRETGRDSEPFVKQESFEWKVVLLYLKEDDSDLEECSLPWPGRTSLVEDENWLEINE